MGTKGKKKAPNAAQKRAAKIAQQKAFEFYEKYRASPDFKKELLMLKRDFEPDAQGMQIFPWLSEFAVTADRRTIEKYLAKLEKSHANAFARLDKKISAFMSKYSLAKEWLTCLRYLALTGNYVVPNTNYLLQKNPLLAHSVSIAISADTTDFDIKQAFKEAQKMLPSRSTKKYSGTYSPVGDILFIDVLKETMADELNKGELRMVDESVNGDPRFDPRELALYEKHKKILPRASDYIYDSRKREGAAKGQKTKIERPEFKNTLSDREYLKLDGLRGKNLEQTVDKLKKRRRGST